MPLHHPIRVAEEWAVVDNLSEGRVDLSFAIGWNPERLRALPQHYAERKAITYRRHRRRAPDVARRAVRDDERQGRARRRHRSPAAASAGAERLAHLLGGAERFAEAGALGFNILTALLFQTVDELAEKLLAYRRRAPATATPVPGHVTLMLHTFVGSDERRVKDSVRAPSRSTWRAPPISGRSARAGSGSLARASRRTCSSMPLSATTSARP